jgi:hypothetical protein
VAYRRPICGGSMLLLLNRFNAITMYLFIEFPYIMGAFVCFLISVPWWMDSPKSNRK